ncbi:MAG: VOC family protein [Anaerolinea sp.]|nr:VOC family protein [Anaerolinea sp.]
MNDYKLPDSAHIGGVRLRVKEMERALQFYRDLLGFTAVRGEDNTVTLSDGQSPPIITLAEHPDAIPKPRRTTGLYHVAILTPDRPALGKVFKRLIESGYPFDGASDHVVSEALYLPDPDGNGLEIYRDRPRETWVLIQNQVQMDTKPLNVRSLLDDADSSAWTGIPAGTIIGHVHLHVSNLARAEAFYADLLGFDVMQRTYPGALFMAAGGYHHHLGTNTWAGAAPPPARSVGLDWFDLVVPGAADDLMRRIHAAGLPIGMDDSEAVLVHDHDGNYVRIVGE